MYYVLKYIHENIKERLSAEETARQFGYSKWHFTRKFYEYAGMTFVEYVRHYRIQIAALEILSGKKITDVAFDYGYDTIGGFNKAFLKEYGCLPREYVKQTKESQGYYERRKLSMYQLTQRVVNLREEVVNKRTYAKKYSAYRNVYYIIGGARALKKGLSSDEVVAEATACVIDNFKPFIAPGELVVGYNFADKPYYESFIPNRNEKDFQILRDSEIPEADIEECLNASEEVRNWNFLSGVHLGKKIPLVPTEVELDAFNDRAALGRCISSNHSVIGYEDVLKLGFEGIYKKIENFEQKNGGGSIYDAMKRVCKASGIIGEKYAEEAKRLLATEEFSEESAYAKEDLELIAEVCSRVPRYPATSFREAVQALWFAHLLNTWEDTVNANSLGRLDQILYPYYKEDLEKGVITKEQAFELICCLWLKLYRDYDVQQSCVGGTNPDGSSAVNELSYMMLDATERLDFVRCLSVRFSSKSEKEFVKRALEVVGHVQKGVPFFFNDDVMIPALISKGIAEEDAYGYTQLGCVETLIPGKTNPHAVSGEANFLKAIEYVLCDGHGMKNPEIACGVKTGDLEQFDTYEKFYEAIVKQVDHVLDITCSMVRKHTDTVNAPKPYKSMLTEGCMESGRDFNKEGALYDYYQIMFEGVPNLADSLAVIKKFVYDEKKYTLAQLKEILEQDFPDEAVRVAFVNKAPKFGNDIDEVDNIAVELVDHACDVLEELSHKYGMSFHAQPFTFLWMIDQGRQTAASPDGRRCGEILAYSVSPMQGRDFNGLTAVLNSIAKFPTKRTPGTTSAIVEVDPKLFTDKNIGILADILLAGAAKGLSNVQFNTIDADTLIDAKAHPEKYNNLAVRVSGFSQKFNLLSPELQEHIIGRTKHACL